MLQKEQNIFAMKIASILIESREFKTTKSLLYVFSAICGLLWPFMVMHGLYGLVWSFYDNISIWTCMVFTLGHRSKSIWSCYKSLW